MMRAARWYGPQDLRIEEMAEPQPCPGEVKVRVHWCGICGTDLHEYRQGPILIPRRPHPLTGKLPPVTLGHEFCGEVAEVGDNSGIVVGERVTANACLVCRNCFWCRKGRYNLCAKLGSIGLSADGAFADFVVVPAYTLHCLPPGVAWEAGALTEPAATAVHACKMGRLRPGESVAIVGAGPIGLLVLQVARALGVNRAYAIEPLANRRRAAEKLGATAVIDPGETAVSHTIAELTDGQRADVVFECVGSSQALEMALQVSGKGGRVVMVGIYAEPFSVSWGRIQAGERELVGASAYTDEFPAALEMLGDGRIQTAPLISDRISLSDITERGFGALSDSPDQHIKILVSPSI